MTNSDSKRSKSSAKAEVKMALVGWMEAWFWRRARKFTEWLDLTSPAARSSCCCLGLIELVILNILIHVLGLGGGSLQKFKSRKGRKLVEEWIDTGSCRDRQRHLDEREGWFKGGSQVASLVSVTPCRSSALRGHRPVVKSGVT